MDSGSVEAAAAWLSCSLTAFCKNDDMSCTKKKDGEITVDSVKHGAPLRTDDVAGLHLCCVNHCDTLCTIGHTFHYEIAIQANNVHQGSFITEPTKTSKASMT